MIHDSFDGVRSFRINHPKVCTHKLDVVSRNPKLCQHMPALRLASKPVFSAIGDKDTCNAQIFVLLTSIFEFMENANFIVLVWK